MFFNFLLGIYIIFQYRINPIFQYGINPITGKKMDSKALFKLNFHKNAEGKYHCPVMYRVFTDTSAIVAIKVKLN